jgi:hypothetical protein
MSSLFIRMHASSLAAILAATLPSLQGAVAQQIINPTILAPSSQQALPKGSMTILPPDDIDAPTPRMSAPHHHRRGGAAAPVRGRRHSYTQ